MQTMEQRLGEAGEVYRQGASGKLAWAAKGLAGTGSMLLARRGRRSRGAAAVGGALVCAGEVCLRYSVFKAGLQSARDPKYTVRPQRERANRAGTKVTTKPSSSAGVERAATPPQRRPATRTPGPAAT